MKIVVVSDTHITSGAVRFPEVLENECRKCDLILHAGDIVSSGVLDELEFYAPVKAVCGNCDVTGDSRMVMPKRIFPLEDVKIGLIHSLGQEPNAFRKNARDVFDDKADIVIFGHTHIPMVDDTERPVLFNPGSLKNNRYGGGTSFGVIRVNESKIVQKNIIYL